MLSEEVEGIAEKLNTTTVALRIKVLDECYNLGCLDHQDYVFLLSLIIATEKLEAIDNDIVQLYG